MNRLESELFDLEESLMRNDGMADGSTYSTIVGIANEVSELESENAKLRILCLALYEFAYNEYPDSAELNFADCMDELGIEVQ